jgi:dihydroorotate dehydrogenase
MIKFSNGRIISNVIISTILGDAGNGMFPYIFYPKFRKLIRDIFDTRTTTFLKSSTRYRNIGNFRPWFPWTWKYVRRIKDEYGNKGILNAHSHDNSGIKKNLPGIKRRLATGYNIIPNLYSTDPKELIEMIGLCYEYLGDYFDTFEYGAWCPNVCDDSCEINNHIVDCVRESKKHFPEVNIIVKLGFGHTYELIKQLEDCRADAFHLINTIPFAEMFGSDKISPLQDVGGGAVSGEITFDRAYIHNINMALRTNLPIIFGCGVSSVRDAERYFELFSKEKTAVSICSIAAINPREARKIILAYNKE